MQITCTQRMPYVAERTDGTCGCYVGRLKPQLSQQQLSCLQQSGNPDDLDCPVTLFIHMCVDVVQRYHI